IFLKNDASTDTRLTSRCTTRCSSKTSWPKILAVPPSFRSSVESSRTSVDLPEPFCPRIATHSPRSIANETPSSAGTRFRLRRSPERVASRRKNSLRKLSTSTAYILVLLQGVRRDKNDAHPRRTAGRRAQESESAEEQHRRERP